MQICLFVIYHLQVEWKLLKFSVLSTLVRAHMSAWHLIYIY